MSNLYRSTLNTADVIGAATVTLVKDTYVKIGQTVVKADERIGMGFGGADAQDTANGRIFCDFKDNSGTPVAVQGMFRIEMESSQDMPIGAQPIVIDVDINTINQGSSDRRAQIAFPFTNVLLSKDKKFVYYIKNTAASAQTLSQANSKCLIDITRQLV